MRPRHHPERPSIRQDRLPAVGAGTLPMTWTRAINRRFDRRKGLALGLALMGTGLFGFISKPFTA